MVGDRGPIPANVRKFLREASRRIEEFQRTHHLAAFVPSDYEQVYRVLKVVDRDDLAPGQAFCEWGSGFGVVACLATMVGFDACGIEIEHELVDEARQLAEDFDLPTEFACASFVTKESEPCLDALNGFTWLRPSGGGTEELDWESDDFDVVFAYPWPDEEWVIGTLFDRQAATGAVLLTYHGGDDLRLRRKRRK